MTNALAKVDDGSIHPAVLRQAIESLVLLLGPMMPHLAEEAWQQLGHTDWVIDTRWPQADPTYLTDETVTIAVQVNGKLRGTIDLPRDSAEDEIRDAARAVENVSSAIGERPLRRAIVVPNRLVNFVV